MTPTTNLGRKWDVELGQLGIKIDPRAYVKQPITAFSPKIGAGNPSHANLDSYQSESITDWSSGMGFITQSDLAGYNFTLGNIDARQSHALQLFTRQVLSASPGSGVTAWADFQGKLYAGLSASASDGSRSSSLWVYTPGSDTWAAAPAGTAGAVKTITVTNAGTGYTSIPTMAASVGTGATFTVRMKLLTITSIAAGGAGYAINDTITLTGGTFSTAILLTVSTVGGGGDVTAVTITNAGNYSGLPGNPVAQGATSGAGVGATFNLGTWGVTAVTVTAGGQSYTAASVASFTGGAGAGAAATLTLTTADGDTHGAPTAAITDLIASQNKAGNNLLFIAYGSTQDFQTHDGTTLYNTPVTGEKARLWAIAGGYMWYADSINLVKYADDPTAVWSFQIKVGSNTHVITALTPFAQQLYVGKTNGLYTITPGQDIALEALTFNSQVAGTNCVGMVQWQGFLYFVIRNNLFRLSPALALSDASPPRYGNDYPFLYLSAFRGFIAGPNYLFYIAKGSATPVNAWWLMAYDGQAHFQLAQLGFVASITPALRATFSLMTTNPTIWYGTDLSGGKLYYTQTRIFEELAYADYPTTGVHYVESSLMDFSLPEITKDFENVMIEVDIGGGSTELQFSLSRSPTWHSLGTADNSARFWTFKFDRIDATVQAATSTTLTPLTGYIPAWTANYWKDATIAIVDGLGAGQTRKIQSQSFGVFLPPTFTVSAWDVVPDETSKVQVTWQGRNIRFRLYLSTTSAALTPVVLGQTIRYRVQPDLRLGWTLRVMSGDFMQFNDGSADPNMDSQQLVDRLMFLRSIKSPVVFRDVDQSSYYVLVTDVKERIVEYKPEEEAQQGQLTYVADVSLAEVDTVAPLAIPSPSPIA